MEAREAVAKLAGPRPDGLLLDLLQAQDTQAALLRHGDLLRAGPWQASRVHLRDAALPGRNRHQVRRSLMLSMAQLHEAVDLLEEGTCERAQAQMDFAVAFVLLDDPASGRHHAELAYREARHALWLLVNGSKGPRSLLATALYLRGRRGEPIERLNGDDLAPLARWYDQVEWCCAFLGDPEGPLFGGPPPTYDWSSTEPVTWRNGAPLDFAFVAYKQAHARPNGEFRSISLARAVEGTPDPLAPPATIAR